MKLISRLITFRYLPLLVLACSLGLTYQSWNAVKHASMFDLKNDFEYRSNDVINRLAERLLSYKQVLVGVQSLFSRPQFVNPREFHAYVTSLNLEQNFPGIHSILFVRNNPAQKSESGKPLYVEQFQKSDLIKLPDGFLSDPRSLAAQAQAIASGEVGVTDKIGGWPDIRWSCAARIPDVRSCIQIRSQQPIRQVNTIHRSQGGRIALVSWWELSYLTI